MRKKLLILFLLAFSFFTIITPALAGPLDLNEQEGFGTGGDIPEAFGQDSKDPKTPTQIASGIINVALSLIGIILVVFFLYAGFLWMTAAGDESKVEKAMGIIKNCVIGLVIVLAAWSISYFVIRSINKAAGGSKGSGNVRII